MKVLFVAAEMTPVAKVGGLADVVGSLPIALRKLGVDVRVVLPHYAMIDHDPRVKVTKLDPAFDVWVNAHWLKQAELSYCEVSGVPVYLLGTDEWFGEAESSDTIYRLGIEQYLFFTVGAIETCLRTGWIPDVIHAHDWHTGLVPAVLRERYSPALSQVASVFTIHNLAYQGEFDPWILDALGLSRALFNSNQLETYGRVNFLKSGMVYADQVSTVSPRYAEEIQTVEYGCALQGLTHFLAQHHRLTGILNGIDLKMFDPNTDPNLPEHYGLNSMKGKAACRKALLQEVELAPSGTGPVFGMVSRISSQKGFDTMLGAARHIFEKNGSIVVLGNGEPWLVDRLSELAAEHPHNMKLMRGFREELAPRIYAGSDGFLMPSKFEPCGLGQMIAMRYGTLPIVRRTGGLADTVQDGVNGFAFNNPDSDELIMTMDRFFDAYQNQELFSKMVENAMTTDFGWDRSAPDYVRVYEKAKETRLASMLLTA